MLCPDVFAAIELNARNITRLTMGVHVTNAISLELVIPPYLRTPKMVLDVEDCYNPCGQTGRLTLPDGTRRPVSSGMR